MPDDLDEAFDYAMVRTLHPRWTHKEVENYIAWRDANRPRTWDHLVRLWRTLRGKQQ